MQDSVPLGCDRHLRTQVSSAWDECCRPTEEVPVAGRVTNTADGDVMADRHGQRPVYSDTCRPGALRILSPSRSAKARRPSEWSSGG